MLGYVYALHLADGYYRYIGVTGDPEKRLRHHKHSPNQLRMKHLPVVRWISKHLDEVAMTIIEVCNTYEQALHREIYWISTYGRGTLLNSTDGGEGTNGFTRADTKQRFETWVVDNGYSYAGVGRYVGCDKKVELICPKGHPWSVKPISVTSGGYSCFSCAHIKTGRDRCLSNVEAVAEAAELCPEFIPLSEYPGRTDYLWAGKHSVCGEFVSPSLRGFRAGDGCCLPCGHKRDGARRVHSDEEARLLAAECMPEFLPTVPYPGGAQKKVAR